MPEKIYNFLQNDLKSRYFLKITHGFRPIMGFLWNKVHMQKPVIQIKCILRGDALNTANIFMWFKNV